MNSLELKNKIIQRIIEIDDVNLLESIDALFNDSDKNVLKFLILANDKFQQESETDNFSDYIKEWVKNM